MHVCFAQGRIENIIAQKIPEFITPCDMRLVLVSILNAKFDSFMELFGLVCSSYVTISKGSHYRCPSSPLGLESMDFVKHGNEFTAKTLVSNLTSPSKTIHVLEHVVPPYQERSRGQQEYTGILDVNNPPLLVL